MNEIESETLNMLEQIGFARSAAKVLIYLSSGQEATSFEMEQVLGLRQPQVSIAIKRYAASGYIETREEKLDPKKGRPVKIYKMILPLKSVIEERTDKIAKNETLILKNSEKLAAAYHSN